MILIGLTGGIGCGKSEVSRLLERHGAVIVDADLIVRELQQPGAEIFRRMVEMFGDKVVVLDIPLLVENPREGLDGILVVDLDPQIAIERIVDQRKMSIDDAKARVSRQSSREQRLAIANHVIDNSGDRDALAKHVEAAWSWITSLR